MLHRLIRCPRVNHGRSSVCALLIERCLAQGSAPALLLEDETSIHTYASLLTSISDLACFLKSKCQLQPSACVALLIDGLPSSIVSALAVIFAGFKLLILDVTSPLACLELTCNRSEVQALIYSSSYSRHAQCLLWSCSSLSIIICIDDDEKAAECRETGQTLALADNQLWDAKVSHADGDDRIAGGWMNAYDGALFTHAEMREFANDVYEHLRPLLCRHWRVLEIGCGSGYTSRVIAPHVREYVATDSSSQMVAYLRAKLELQQWPMMTFETVSAEDIEKRFSPNSFNLIIMNSVVHCFPTHAFLTNVIQQCIRLLDPAGGVLFIGDVMDLNKRDEMLHSVRQYQQENPLSEVQLDWSHILFLPPDYFHQLSHSIRASVRILPRIGTIDNELTRYDYDVIISMTPSARPAQSPSKVAYTKSDLSGQGSIDELAVHARAVSLDMDAYVASHYAADHRALRNYVDWACQTLCMNETTVVPLWEFDFPLIICLLCSGGKIMIFDSFERAHQNIANFTRRQLSTILDDARLPLSESTIALTGIYENADQRLFHGLQQHQHGEKTLPVLWSECCFDHTLVDDASIFSANLIVRCNLPRKPILACGNPSMHIFNGQYIDLCQIEHELKRLPCIEQVWVAIVTENKQDLLGAVYRVCDNAASFDKISWFERFVNYAKTCLPPRLIPSLWARTDVHVDDRHTLVDILLATNKPNADDRDREDISFDEKIQRLVQTALHLDHLPNLNDDFFPERQTHTLFAYRLVRALQTERPDYTHTDLFRHRTLQDVIDYLRSSPSVVF